MAHNDLSGFEKVGLDEDAFGERSGLGVVKAFDAFPKTKATYTTATAAGGYTTVALVIICVLLSTSEILSWFRGAETHHFSVEGGVGHELQLNLDMVVAMPCKDLHVNVQDAAMDRIMAGDLLSKDDTNWQIWTDQGRRRRGGAGAYKNLDEQDRARQAAEEEDQHVAHVLGHMREGGKKFAKSPRLRRWEPANACRIYGSLEGNKVQGDFHVTARGHGYMEFGAQHHLDHSTFNFSHYVNELSFGPHYPNIINPLDRTMDATEINFYKFQYYLSIVPTIFTKRRVSTRSGSLDPAAIPQPPTLDAQPKATPDKDGIVRHRAHPQRGIDDQTVFTNQYAATSQSREVPSNTIPGIFFKYDIEPILLIVSEQRTSFLALLVRLVNVVSGVLVGGGWMFQLWAWGNEVAGRRARRSGADGDYGVLNGRVPGLG